MRRIIYQIQRRLVRGAGKNIDYTTMKRMIKDNKDIVIIDVRTEEEFRNKHIPGAINVPLQDVEQKIGRIVRNKNNLVIMYCEYGGRSAKACRKMEKMGYTNVYNLDGGIEGI